MMNYQQTIEENFKNVVLETAKNLSLCGYTDEAIIKSLHEVIRETISEETFSMDVLKSVIGEIERYDVKDLSEVDVAIVSFNSDDILYPTKSSYIGAIKNIPDGCFIAIVEHPKKVDLDFDYYKSKKKKVDTITRCTKRATILINFDDTRDTIKCKKVAQELSSLYNIINGVIKYAPRVKSAEVKKVEEISVE